MKLYLLLFILLFTIISCQKEEFETNNELEYNIKNNQQFNISNKSSFNIEEFNYNLKLVTYITGRVLLKYTSVRNNILDNLNDNTVIKFNNLFDDIDDFKNAFYIEGSGFDLFGRPGSHRPIPPIDMESTRTNYVNNFNIDGRNVVENPFLPNSIDAILYFLHNNCLEMYLVKPLEIFDEVLNQHLYITQHPLIDGQFVNNFKGFDLWQYENSDHESANNGTYIPFDEELFYSQEKNIIVVRPNNDGVCNYEDIPVVDFAKFYSN